MITLIGESLKQWEIGRKVKIETEQPYNEVHFAQIGDVAALVIEPNCNTAEVPNILLQEARKLVVYLVHKTNEGETVQEMAKFNIESRPKPTDYVYTETEALTVADFVTKALIKAKESGDFKGDKGDKGDSGSIDFKVVDELPTEDISENSLYLVPIINDDDSNNYLEYIYVDGRWECIDTVTFSGNLDDYVKKDDYATDSKVGLVKGGGNCGTSIHSSSGTITIDKATVEDISKKADNYKPIVPLTLDYATMKALTDPKNIAWDDTQKALARATLGAVGSEEYVSTPSTDNVSGTYGVVRLRGGMGISAAFNGAIYIVTATNKKIDERTHKYEPITPSNLDYAVKKALSDCKLSGDNVWTDEEKVKALELLGGVAKIKGTWCVLTTDGEGKVVGVQRSNSKVASSIPQRDSNGNIEVGNAVKEDDAVNKKYVDDLVGDVQTILTELHTYAETLVGGGE